MINPRIKDILTEYRIPYKDGLSVLISIYYDCVPSYTDLPVVERLYKKVLSTGICSGNHNVGKGVEWRIPLFEDQLTQFDWVKEYVEVFKKCNPSVPGTVTECTKRFKKFYSEHPTVRFEDIKGAVNMYLKSLNDYKYIMHPHYFIYKGVGLDKTSMLEYWLEEYYKEKGSLNSRNSLSNTMK